MAIIRIGPDTTEVGDLGAALYDKTIIRPGTLVYLVAASYVPVELRTPTAGPDGDGYLHIYDGGIKLTRGADYASAADLLAVPPEPGYVRWFFDTDATYVRLGSVPAFDLRAQAVGYAADGAAAWTSEDIIDELGLSITSAGVLAVEGYYVDDDRTSWLDLLNDYASRELAAFGIDRLGRFVVHRWDVPAGEPAWVFHLDDCIEFARRLPSSMSYPVWRLVINLGQTWPQSRLAMGIPDERRDWMTRQPWTQTRIYETPDVKDKHRLATELEVSSRAEVSPVGDGAFTLMRDRLEAMFGVEREEIDLEVRLDGRVMQLEINDVVEVHANRLGLDGGKLMRIVAIELQLKRKRARFVLWG